MFTESYRNFGLKEGLAAYLGRTPDQIRRTLARAAPRLLDAVPFIGTFLGSLGEKLAEGVNETYSLKGVYEELSRILVRATAGSAGLFLLIDDLHAADPDTLYFLNYLFRKLDQIPVLAVATIQEEQLYGYPELADLVAEWTASGYVTLTVVPLERARVGEYVRNMAIAGKPADDSIVDRLFQLTGGNPYHRFSSGTRALLRAERTAVFFANCKPGRKRHQRRYCFA